MERWLAMLIIAICGCTPVRWAKQWYTLNTKLPSTTSQVQTNDSPLVYFYGNNGYRYSQAQGWAYFDYTNNFGNKIVRGTLYNIEWVADPTSLNGVAFLINESTLRVLIKLNRFALRIGNIEQINVQIIEPEISLELPLFIKGLDLDNETVCNTNVDGPSLIKHNAVRGKLAEIEIRRVEKDKQRKIISDDTANKIKAHLSRYLANPN